MRNLILTTAYIVKGLNKYGALEHGDGGYSGYNADYYGGEIGFYAALKPIILDAANTAETEAFLHSDIYPGVLEYEVFEAFGEWLAEQTDGNDGCLPSAEACHQEVQRRLLDFFEQV